MATREQIRQRDATIAQFCRQVQARNLSVTVEQIGIDVDWLHRQEKILHGIMERQCNGYSNECTGENDDQREQSDQRKQKRVEEKVQRLLECYHIKVRFEGDPRGGTIRMYFDNKAGNNWGGEDWGIYW